MSAGKKKQAMAADPVEIEFELVEKGWQAVKRDDKTLWRHPRLDTSWPIGDALRLQDEADNGRQDPVHRALRGEET